MKKKILFVITKSNWGGAQRYVYDLATNVSKDDFDPVVAFGNEGGTDQGMLSEQLQAAGIRTILIPELMRDIGPADSNAWYALKKVIESEIPDVLHLNSSKAGALGALAGRIAGVPRIIFTAHGWPYWENRPFYMTVLLRIASWVTVILSHKTICVSGYDRKSMKQAPFTKRKLVIVRNGIEPFTLVERNEARAKLYSSEELQTHANDSWLVTNAELTANKNIRAGIEAVAIYNAKNTKKIYWSLMGDGEERSALEAQVQAAGMTSQIKFLGFIPDGRSFLKAFDAFFLPSQKEGLPYAILEAGIAELPVAASRVGGIPELIGNGNEGVLANPSDKEAFVEILKSVFEHKEWGTALHTKVIKDHSMKLMILETTSLYH